MKIVTHSGPYHLDDVIAGAILSAIYDVPIVRTRDPTIISSADIAFDVGGGKFDHHFKGAEKRTTGNFVTYSACGLIWREYGREFLSKIKTYPAYIEDCWSHWDKIITIVDAHDNGETGGVELKNTLSIAAIIGAFNGSKPYEYVVNFMKEYLIAKTASMVQFQFDKSSIMSAIEAANGGLVIELPGEMSWQTLICEHAPNALFVIYPQEHQWRVNAVPISPGSFVSKRVLSPKLCGLTPDKLKEYDLNFVHINGFTAAGKSKNSVLKLIEKTLEN
jgi:uncharacterized UPF0160 family protein